MAEHDDRIEILSKLCVEHSDRHLPGSVRVSTGMRTCEARGLQHCKIEAQTRRAEPSIDAMPCSEASPCLRVRHLQNRAPGASLSMAEHTFSCTSAAPTALWTSVEVLDMKSSIWRDLDFAAPMLYLALHE